MPLAKIFTGFKFTFRALKYKNYRVFFAGQSISLIGMWIQNVAMGWLVYRLTGSATLLGVVGFAENIPVFLLTPFAGDKAMEVFDGFSLTVVTYHCGFREPFKNRMADDVKKDIEGKGIGVIASIHALSGLERSVAKQFSGAYPVLLIADTLRLFGQGTKVAVEVAIMAADGGALSGADIISIGGSGSGADSALVLKPAHQNNFFDMRIREIICKPRQF